MRRAERLWPSPAAAKVHGRGICGPWFLHPDCPDHGFASVHPYAHSRTAVAGGVAQAQGACSATRLAGLQVRTDRVQESR